jgi:hypothetical protein
VSNRNLSIPTEQGQPPSASVMLNAFPTATGVVSRRGSRRWATLSSTARIGSMFTYSSGSDTQMFAAIGSGIRDVSSEASATTIIGPDVLTGQTGADWSVVQFSTAGGQFLVGVNGADPAFLYNGTTFTATTITFPVAFPGKTTAMLSYVWVYKQRIWFVEKGTLNAWYLPVDQVGGELKLLPLGGVFTLGGALQWGHAWSLDTGSAGGLSEQCVFTTTEGQVAVYQGLSPDPGQGWEKANQYRIGKPLGNKAFMVAGGDLVVATTVGFISLSAAARLDYAALGMNAVSYPIEDEWRLAVANRGVEDWRVQVWAEGQMVIISPPQLEGENPEVFVTNVVTGKWAKFNGWDISAMTSAFGRLYFGSNTGYVRLAWDGGADEGEPYQWQVLPLFTDMGYPGAQKTLKMARAITRSPYGGGIQVSGHVNFQPRFPVNAPLAPVLSNSLWDTGLWNEAIWGGRNFTITTGAWVSVGGAGSDMSVGVQGRCGTEAPVDIEIIRIDAQFQFGDAAS